MNVWEKRLITAIKKACAANGAQTLYDGQRLCALIESADPELAQQREYKNFRALVRCGGNTLLAQSAHAPRAELQKNIETLGRSMGKGSRGPRPLQRLSLSPRRIRPPRRRAAALLVFWSPSWWCSSPRPSAQVRAGRWSAACSAGISLPVRPGAAN